MIVDKIKKRETKNIRPSNKVDIQVGKWVKCDKCKKSAWACVFPDR